MDLPLLEVMLALAILRYRHGGVTDRFQRRAGVISTFLEEKTVAGWVAENQDRAALPDDPWNNERSGTVASAIWQEAAGTGEPHR